MKNLSFYCSKNLLDDFEFHDDVVIRGPTPFVDDLRKFDCRNLQLEIGINKPSFSLLNISHLGNESIPSLRKNILSK